MFQAYPKWKYTQGQALMVDDADAEAALGDGWHDFPEEVPELTEVGQNTADIEGLRASAVAMGIAVDKRWGAQRLEDEIKAKILAEGEHADPLV